MLEEEPLNAAKRLVSIVTPSFNQARFLEETIRSVALQDYRPIQHIIIDGGSTDGSVEILKRCSKEFEHGDYSLEWVSEPDHGMPDALGKGFDRARGEILGWLNSDDVYFDRYAVTSAAAEFERHPQVDVVYGDVALISETSGLMMVWCFPNFDYKRALRGYIIPQPTVFLRRKIVSEHPIGSLRFVGIDHAYWLEIGRTNKFRHIHRLQAADRDHASRLSLTKHSQWTEEGRRYLASYGNGYFPTGRDHAFDVVTRALMRLKASAYLANVLTRKQKVAFPMWTDGLLKIFIRQLTMRIGNRPHLGPRKIEWRIEM